MIIGYTTGVFDMFHIGHLKIIKEAKKQCDFLIVGVSTDDLVIKEKKKKPIIPFEERCEIIKAVKYVDQVVPQEDKNKFAAWERYHFNKVFVGSDWKGADAWNDYETQFNTVDVKIVYFEYTEGISSTILRDRLVEIYGINNLEKK